MSAALPVSVAVPSLAMNEGELISVLSNSLYPGAKPESIKLVIGYCRARGLDPMQKPVHIVPMDVKTGRKENDGKDIYEKRDVIMPGVGMYRTDAARTNAYAGKTEPDFGPEKKLSFKDGQKDESIDYPEWCRVTVRRMVNGQIVDFTAKELWLENYATAGNWTKAPNKMWKKRPFAQLAKCAEAQALRMAFPEVGSAPTADEMEGKVIDADVVVEPARAMIEQPRARQESVTPASASTSATASSAESAVANSASGGGSPDRKDAPPMKPSQVNILKAKLAHAALTETDLEVAFAGKSLEPKAGKDLFSFDDFGPVQDWISKNSKA